jgi:hypothetical protein
MEGCSTESTLELADGFEPASDQRRQSIANSLTDRQLEERVHHITRPNAGAMPKALRRCCRT